MSTTEIEDQPVMHNEDQTAFARVKDVKVHDFGTSKPRWRPGWLTVLITILALGGMAAGLYPMTSSWLSSYNQSKIITSYAANLDSVEPSVAEQLKLARMYNDALTAGVIVGAHTNLATGDGHLADESLDYKSILKSNGAGMMSRVKIPAIDVDLPVYHGTSEAVLLKGAGHLEGSHLPIGGENTRSVITAHRGLANSTMFTHLNEVQVGDTFTVETFGEVLTYRVRDTQVIAPSDTDTLKVEPGEDLVTLITCTPLGINTHRILVTGERVTPTPPGDLLAAGAAPTIPGFPWWLVWGIVGFGLVVTYLLRRGFVDARIRLKTAHRPKRRKVKDVGK